MADDVDAAFEDAEVDHERDGECTVGSAMSARDDGEDGVIVDMDRVPSISAGAQKLHFTSRSPAKNVAFVHVWMRTSNHQTRTVCQSRTPDNSHEAEFGTCKSDPGSDKATWPN